MNKPEYSKITEAQKKDEILKYLNQEVHRKSYFYYENLVLIFKNSDRPSANLIEKLCYKLMKDEIIEIDGRRVKWTQKVDDTLKAGGYVKKEILHLKEENNDMEKLIFISHATKDKEIIDAFVDLILHGGLSVQIDKIFCVSTDGTKIKSGDDWRNSIKISLLSAKLNFLIITPNYKESEVCLNEMGAAWVTSATVLPLIVEPINYKTVGIIQEPNQIEKLLDEKSLDRIKDIVQEKLEIPSSLIKSDRWTTKKNEFLMRVKKHISINPFEIPLDRTTFINLLKNKEDLERTVEGLIDKKKELESLINELKKAKDKAEVTSIINKRKKSTLFQQFEELCAVVNQNLMGNDSIVNGIIFNTFTGKEIEIKWQGNKTELDEALANDYITRDLEANWYTTKKMKNTKNSLDRLSEFMTGDLPEDFFDSYEENYESPFDIGNKSFWKEAFGQPISFK